MIASFMAAIYAAPDPQQAFNAVVCFAGIVFTLFVLAVVSTVLAYRDGARARRRAREFTIRRARMRQNWRG